MVWYACATPESIRNETTVEAMILQNGYSVDKKEATMPCFQDLMAFPLVLRWAFLVCAVLDAIEDAADLDARPFPASSGLDVHGVQLVGDTVQGDVGAVLADLVDEGGHGLCPVVRIPLDRRHASC